MNSMLNYGERWHTTNIGTKAISTLSVTAKYREESVNTMHDPVSSSVHYKRLYANETHQTRNNGVKRTLHKKCGEMTRKKKGLGSKVVKC